MEKILVEKSVQRKLGCTGLNVHVTLDNSQNTGDGKIINVIENFHVIGIYTKTYYKQYVYEKGNQMFFKGISREVLCVDENDRV